MAGEVVALGQYRLALAYARDGGFVDWARGMLAGESQAALADAFTQLAAAVAEVRERENEAFARSLAAWTTAARPWTQASHRDSEKLSKYEGWAKTVAPASRAAACCSNS